MRQQKKIERKKEREEERKKKERKKERRRTKSNFSCAINLTVRKINGKIEVCQEVQ